MVRRKVFAINTIIFFVVFIFITLSSSVAQFIPRDNPPKFNILYTNDVRGYFEPCG